jgi:acetylornithine deacetylase/succinyl-diaminopimelate desuccinylase-like protein
MTDRSSLDAVLNNLKANDRAAIDRLIEWLRIPSVGTDPAHRGDTRRAAEWCAERLRAAGLDAELRETGTPEKPGHPIVWASNAKDHPGAASLPPSQRPPHVLFYGHYDVQPADPLELWTSPPFEPVVLPADSGPAGRVPGERIVARGAVDDKGQVACFLEALRAWREVNGPLPILLSVLIEGEEESGSVNLERYVTEHAAELKAADIVLISDTGMLDRGRPAITYGVRGLAYTEVFLTGPDQDLHSGLWGGRVLNPNNELCKILAQLWDENGRVTIPGFYDDVLEPTAEERAAWNALVPDEPAQRASLKSIGLPMESGRGEGGWTGVEREWARPTCDINGIKGGYIGEGAKTVIPSQASAKVSFRLVANQDPAKIVEAFGRWLDERVPPGFTLRLHDHGGGWPGNVAQDSPYLRAAAEALEAAAGGVRPALIKSGGSIPVVGLLKKTLGLDTLLVGFGLEDDRVHSPNEKFELECFRLGMRTHAAILERFAHLRV